MLRRIVRTALVAGAGVMLSWAMQSLMDKRRRSKHLEHKAERKVAVSDWENEGGGLAPAHDPRL
jgi:hypothetical protein